MGSNLKIWLGTALIITTALTMMMGCTKKQIENSRDSFSYIEENFQDPPAAYRPAPFWIWHEVLTKEKIREQLTDFREKGIGGVFVHPRYGLVTEYLSDEWFEMFAYTLEVAQELDMEVWIYDENSFPSGFAGGHVPAQMPESYNQGQGLVISEQDVFNPDPDGRYLHFFKSNGENEYIPVVDVENERRQEGSYYLLELINYPQTKWYGGFSYVDLIYPGVTEKFLEITMEGYEKFSDHFGGVIKGVFTDEPNIAPPGGRTSVKWTPDLYDRFFERWGYRLEDNIMSLYKETGDWKRVRHNYFQLLLQLFIDRWAKPWYEYTESKNLIWTGHYWEHGWPSPHHGGDNMAMYAWHQMPGIDLLFNTMEQGERPTQFGDPRNVKELKSVANQMGRRRTLSETYGAAGWELTMEEQKRLGDWAYALGLNFLNPHLAYMTLLGDRKHDFPQSFSYHVPYWDLYKYKTDYFARLSLALTTGNQFNNILVIEPTSTTWMYYSSYQPNEHINTIGNSFQDMLDKMEAWQIEYDLGSENIIKDHGYVRKGKFGINQREYELVVTPFGMENIDKATFELLGQYLAQGGKVVSIGHYPVYVDGIEEQQLQSIISANKEHWLLADDFMDAHVAELFFNDEIRFELRDYKSRKLFHQRRQLDDGQLVFLVNSDLQSNATGSFYVDGVNVALLNAENGVISDFPFERADGKIKVDFDLKPANSLLLFISDRRMDFIPSADTGDFDLRGLRIPISSIIPTSENVLVLDYCRLKISGEQETSLMYFYTAGDKIWQHYGFPDNPWVSSSQFKTELVDRDTFAIGTVVELTFPFRVGAGTNTKGMRAVVERPEIFRVSINGNEVFALENEWYLEKDFGVYDIGQWAKPGNNEIKVSIYPMSMFAEVAPVFITGNFSLESENRGWSIVPSRDLQIGSWKQQGYPFYSGSVAYKKQMALQHVPEKVIVQFNEWKGTAAEVIVNGKHAGFIGWQPYQVDITGQVTAGSNEVEVRVYGSLKNILGPHHLVRRRGIVTPWSFKYAPEQQPPGNEYDLLDYGLMGDFRILTSN
jgi:hypothetical protein